MLCNSQLQHILILIALGVIVFYLSKPKKTSTKENMENIDDIENFAGHGDHQDIISEEEDNISYKSNIDDDLKFNIQEQVTGNVNDNVNDFKSIQTTGGSNIDAAFKSMKDEGSKENTVDFNKNYLKEYKCSDYLPRETNDSWFATDFSQAKNKDCNENLIDTNYVIGVNTVGSTLKNATYDLRGTESCPKYTVCPWNNSSIEPDYNLKSLCS